MSPYFQLIANPIKIGSKEIKRQSRSRTDWELDDRSQNSTDEFFRQVLLSPISTGSVISDFSPYINHDRSRNSDDFNNSNNGHQHLHEIREENTMEFNSEARATQTALSMPPDYDLSSVLAGVLELKNYIQR